MPLDSTQATSKATYGKREQTSRSGMADVQKPLPLAPSAFAPQVASVITLPSYPAPLRPAGRHAVPHRKPVPNRVFSTASEAIEVSGDGGFAPSAHVSTHHQIRYQSPIPTEPARSPPRAPATLVRESALSNDASSFHTARTSSPAAKNPARYMPRIEDVERNAYEYSNPKLAPVPNGPSTAPRDCRLSTVTGRSPSLDRYTSQVLRKAKASVHEVPVHKPVQITPLKSVGSTKVKIEDASGQSHPTHDGYMLSPVSPIAFDSIGYENNGSEMLSPVSPIDEVYTLKTIKPSARRERDDYHTWVSENVEVAPAMPDRAYTWGQQSRGKQQEQKKNDWGNVKSFFTFLNEPPEKKAATTSSANNVWGYAQERPKQQKTKKEKYDKLPKVLPEPAVSGPFWAPHLGYKPPAEVSPVYQVIGKIVDWHKKKVKAKAEHAREEAQLQADTAAWKAGRVYAPARPRTEEHWGPLRQRAEAEAKQEREAKIAARAKAALEAAEPAFQPSKVTFQLPQQRETTFGDILEAGLGKRAVQQSKQSASSRHNRSSPPPSKQGKVSLKDMLHLGRATPGSANSDQSFFCAGDMSIRPWTSPGDPASPTFIYEDVHEPRWQTQSWRDTPTWQSLTGKHPDDSAGEDLYDISTLLPPVGFGSKKTPSPRRNSFEAIARENTTGQPSLPSPRPRPTSSVYSIRSFTPRPETSFMDAGNPFHDGVNMSKYHEALRNANANGNHQSSGSSVQIRKGLVSRQFENETHDDGTRNTQFYRFYDRILGEE